MNNIFYNIKQFSLKEFTNYFNDEIEDINILIDFIIEGVSSINIPKEKTIIFVSKNNIKKFDNDLMQNISVLITGSNWLSTASIASPPSPKISA